MPTLGNFDAERVGQVDGVLDDVALDLEVREDVDGRIGHDEHLRIGGNVHDEGVADPARGAKTRRRGHDGPHDLVGVQAPLHEGLHLARTGQFDGLCGRGVAVLRGYDPVGRKIDLRLLGRLPDLVLGPDKHRDDEAAAGRLDGAHEGIPVAGVRNGAGNGLATLAALDELREGIAPAKLELRRLDVVVDKPRRGRLHRHRAGHEFFARLVDTAGIKDDEVPLLAFFLYGDLRRKRIPHGEIPAKRRSRCRIFVPGPGQACAEEDGYDGLGTGRLGLFGLLPLIRVARLHQVKGVHVP